MGIKDGVLRVPFPSYNMPGIGRKRRKRRKGKRRVHRRRRQAKDTAADIQSKKEEKARKRKLYDFMLEEICEAVLRIEANDDALAADDVVADTGVPTIEDAVHSRLPEGTPEEPLTISDEKRKAAAEAENEVEVAAPVKEESRYSANAIASIDAHTLCGCVGVCGCVQASRCLPLCVLVL